MPLVGPRKGIQDRLVLGRFLQQHIVGQGNHGVAHAPQRQQTFLGLLETTAALEAERHGHKRDDERTLFGRDFRDDRRSAAARAASHARQQKHQVAILHHRGDFFAIRLRGFTAQFRIAAGAEPAGHARADENLVLHGRRRQRLQIGVDHRELEALEVFHLEAVHRIGTRAAHPHQFDGNVAVGENLVLERKFVGIHFKVTNTKNFTEGNEREAF